MMSDVLCAILLGVILTESMAKLSLTLSESIDYVFGSEKTSWLYCSCVSYKCRLMAFYTFSVLLITSGFG
jgi:hypothetical protein